ncbi:MAG TPA: F0F1 ATP synthase subunit A [Acidobacteriaceae bacterium]|jgi:F-type H+-transporting ATPase subunit a|nr:F0F1 ATP synthase subunit A [Acidobacteriaceae bacterium]
MPVLLPFTAFLNHYFAGVANALLALLHLHPQYPQAPITNSVAMEIVVVLALLVFFVIVRATLSVDKPGPAQHIAEILHGFVSEQAESIIGHDFERYVPFVTVVFIFILLSNLLSLLPGFISPTAKPWVPLGVATLTFLYYQYHGIRENGVGYIKQFLGPIWWLAPLMLPIEIISHFARILSLTVRLYANMFAGDLVVLAFFSLIPIAFPAVFLGLHLLVSVIQAAVFMLLAMIYLGQATAHDH